MSHPMYEIEIISELGNQAAASLQSLGVPYITPSLTTLVPPTGDPSLYANSYLIEDEGDVFQCGRCKKQFGSLMVFMHHKREGCSIEETNSLSREEYILHSKYDHQEVNGDHYISTGTQIEGDEGGNERGQERAFETVSTYDGLTHEQGDHNRNEENHSGCESSILSGATPVIHFTPSIVLGEETLSFTIPVDQNSGLAQLLSGANSSTVLSIPENELAALISSAGERYHLSSIDPSNPMNSQNIYLTASLLPSNDKESPENHYKDSSDSPQYVEEPEDNGGEVCDGSSASYLLQDDDLSELPISGARGVSNVIKKNRSYVKTSTNKPAEVQTNYEDQVHTSDINGDDVSASHNINSHSEKSQLQFDPQLEIGLTSEERAKGCMIMLDGKRKCEFCGKLFKKLFNLHQHIRSHTGEKPFHCLVCGRGFTQKSNVKKHMQTHKVWPKVKYTLPKEQLSVKFKDIDFPMEGENLSKDSNAECLEYIVNNVYVCQYCDQHFENYHKLKTHLSNTHKNEKLFKCIHKDCLATFLEVEGLIHHMKTHEEDLEYQCQNCPKKFKSLLDLGTHQYTHRLYPNKVSTTSGKNFKCKQCNSRYASAEALNHHILTSSHDYPCSKCQLTFVCERYLRRHLRIHGTVEPFKCDRCGKMFKTENYLKSHLVIHSDSKPFHCEICNLSFNRRDKLTRHKLMHDNRKKYKCPFKNAGCEREFYRKDKLKDHMMSHSRKVFNCSKCGKNFAWAARLRQHQVTHHPDMKGCTTCPVCHRIFKTKNNLKGHVCKMPISPCSSPGSPEIGENAILPGSPGSPLVSEKSFLKDDITEVESVLVGGEPVKKMAVLYKDCDMEDAVNRNEERSEDAMLGSFNHTDDTESEILTNYADCEDRDMCTDHDVNDEGVMGPMEMPFENGVDGQIDAIAY